MHLLIKSGAVYFTACSLAIWNKKVKILVTGGAGFIGSAVVRHIINNTQDSVVNVDKLTYAGNLESLAEISDSERYSFEHADICDAEAMARIFAQHQPDAVIFSLILLLGASILVKISIGPGYDNAVIVLMIISPLPFLISLSNVYGIQVMLTHNYKKEFSKILIAAGLLSLLLIFPLTTLFKEIGAAITLLATECLVTSLMLMFVRNNKLLVC